MTDKPTHSGGGRGPARTAWAIAAFVLGMSLSAGGSAPAAEFRLRAECRSSGALVTLGDVAEIYATDRRQADSLAAIELFPAPVAPRQRFVRLREIEDLLLLRGVKLSEHRFSGASQVAVRGNGEPARGEREPPLPSAAATRAARRIQDALLRYLQERVAADSSWNMEIKLSESQTRWAADPTRTISITGGHSPWTGGQRFEVTVALPNGPVQFPLEARITVPPGVVVAARSLRVGEILRATDVRLQPITSREERTEAIYSIDEVIGMQTTRGSSRGQVLQKKSLRPPLLVRRNDPVVVHARSSGIHVQTMARARNDGALGEAISVESLSDRRRYLARVVGVREVEVFTRPAPVNPAPVNPARTSGPPLGTALK